MFKTETSEAFLSGNITFINNPKEFQSLAVEWAMLCNILNYRQQKPRVNGIGVLCKYAYFPNVYKLYADKLGVWTNVCLGTCTLRIQVMSASCFPYFWNILGCLVRESSMLWRWEVCPLFLEVTRERLVFREKKNCQLKYFQFQIIWKWWEGNGCPAAQTHNHASINWNIWSGRGFCFGCVFTNCNLTAGKV